MAALATLLLGISWALGAMSLLGFGLNPANLIALPLTADHRQDMEMFVDTVKRHYREIGLVYLCNPNNPTGVPVTAAEVAYLLDNIPEDVPVLIDEAYHHFVEDPAYHDSLAYVHEGRRVVVTRTFSKAHGLAALRIGYSLSNPEIADLLKIIK